MITVKLSVHLVIINVKLVPITDNVMYVLKTEEKLNQIVHVLICIMIMELLLVHFVDMLV